MKRQEELNDAWCKYRGKCSADDLNVLKFALQWCDEHPHWISVEDELPPKESEYDDNSIVVLTTDGNDVYKGLYRSGEYLSGWFTHDLWAINNITHWMPLPVPPSESVTTCNHKTSSSSEIPTNLKGGEKC